MTIDYDVCTYTGCQEVQDNQDRKIPWGQCIVTADTSYPLGEL